ncbi:hypothetical protein GUITHDRAFT_139276 [Guillardia theta CCMP2712]|uniref:Isopenicillin N synthase-like Fe(2+) 2OG dioxygenase domain-containing protein n=1 Tax=Guillardia theta (strain CCMP2712) TaxID=905079 RepID=L1JA75_GUITC|nr:hypothetical protein GUITHDRAFT_139276 [Guillardia theta CCMP2712]EKX44990.1 hypothetical protein GUITHDRAFT_139276 [Guillardia theta CCMP2712]|eukprot:XP_005831970.1 hypothetical protein GUITHDRAFT_139276 [Guillardia theta CCMP2712]
MEKLISPQRRMILKAILVLTIFQCCSAFLRTPLDVMSRRFLNQRTCGHQGKLVMTAVRTEESVVEATRRTVASTIRDDLKDLDQRLYAAPFAYGSKVPTHADCINLLDLELEDGAGPHSRRLCDILVRDHYAIIKLPRSSSSSLDQMWETADKFFGMDQKEKALAGGKMSKAANNVGVIGWGQMSDGNEFLEMRLTANGQIFPPSLDDFIPDFTSSTRRARELLMRASKAVVVAAERKVGLRRGGLSNLLDDGRMHADGSLSSTQHRFCFYKSSSQVAFEAHTDTTFVTVIPCSKIPGLEVLSPEEGWIQPESSSGVDQTCSVIVMPGEMLQVLTGGQFQAAIHRVTRSSSSEGGSSAQDRVSAPLLEQIDNKSILLEADTPGTRSEEVYGGGGEYLRRKLKSLTGTSLFDLHSVLVQPPQFAPSNRQEERGNA